MPKDISWGRRSRRRPYDYGMQPNRTRSELGKTNVLGVRTVAYPVPHIVKSILRVTSSG